MWVVLDEYNASICSVVQSWMHSGNMDSCDPMHFVLYLIMFCVFYFVVGRYVALFSMCIWVFFFFLGCKFILINKYSSPNQYFYRIISLTNSLFINMYVTHVVNE
jgi:hypothetical protein